MSVVNHYFVRCRECLLTCTHVSHQTFVALLMLGTAMSASSVRQPNGSMMQ
jgi:hypothetical protein